MKHIKQYSKAVSIFAILFLAHALCSTNLFAQSQNVGINYTGATPNASALLDINNQTGPFKGLLIPRVTNAQRLAMNPLPEAAQGLVVYQTDVVGLSLEGFYYNTSTNTTPVWVNLASSGGAVTGISVATSNGLAGSSSGGATPIITLSTNVTGLLKGNGTAISAATESCLFPAAREALCA